MRKACFLGVAASALEKIQIEDEIDDDTEIWVVNEAHRSLPEGRKPDRVFQMHVRDWRESERVYLGRGELPPGLDHDCFGRNHEHVEYLRTCGVPVICQQIWPDIPTSVRYPFEAVTQAVGIALPPHGNKRLWATSSFGYMAAMLITEAELLTDQLGGLWPRLSGGEVESLQLLAIELPLGTQRERIWEWPNFAYYLGLAAGLGIEIKLPSTGTSLLSAPHYALDGQPHVKDADHWWAPGYAGVSYDEEDEVYRLGNAAEFAI